LAKFISKVSKLTWAHIVAYQTFEMNFQTLDQKGLSCQSFMWTEKESA